jgi:hypothetical protein
MKLRTIATATALALTLGIAALGAASGTEAAPKPGLVPGKWIGTGTISGTSQDGELTTSNRGLVTFTVTVAADRSVSGSGTWKRTMTGSGLDTQSVIIGTASLKFSGPSTEVRFAGKEYAQGKVVVNGTTIQMGTKGLKLEGLLVLARAGDCTANGTAKMIETRGGLTLKWKAKRVIRGTCNA